MGEVLGSADETGTIFGARYPKDALDSSRRHVVQSLTVLFLRQKPGWGVQNGCLSSDFASYSAFINEVQRTVLQDPEGEQTIKKFFAGDAEAPDARPKQGACFGCFPPATQKVKPGPGPWVKGRDKNAPEYAVGEV